MFKKILIIAASLLILPACGSSGGGGGGSSAPVSQSVTATATGFTISGQVDLNGATLEAPATAPTVEVNGNAATVTATGDVSIFDWTITLAASCSYTNYRVEYFANGNLIGAVDYNVDP